MNFTHDTLTLDDWNDVGKHISNFSVGINLLNNVTRIQQAHDINLCDAFSKGQLCSKAWLTEALNHCGEVDTSDVVICGGWYGVLAPLLFDRISTECITSIDIDSSCEEIANMLNSDHWHQGSYAAITHDMHNYNYAKHTCIINTSCEHIPDLAQWYDALPTNAFTVLQTNNFYTGKGHINCVDSIDQFMDILSPTKVFFAGTLRLPDYERYMIISR